MCSICRMNIFLLLFLFDRLLMPRNIEIKARIDGTLQELIERIQPLADGPPIQLSQIDTFFPCPSGGRLKLRLEEVKQFKEKIPLR